MTGLTLGGLFLKSEHHSLSASQMKLQGDRSTPGRQSVSAVEMTSQRRSSISSQVSEGTRTESGVKSLNNCVLGLRDSKDCTLNFSLSFFVWCLY